MKDFYRTLIFAVAIAAVAYIVLRKSDTDYSSGSSQETSTSNAYGVLPLRPVSPGAGAGAGCGAPLLSDAPRTRDPEYVEQPIKKTFWKGPYGGWMPSTGAPLPETDLCDCRGADANCCGACGSV